MFVANNSIYKLVEGEVYSWGENSYGQLGLGDTKKRSISSKEKVNLPEKIIDLVVGKNFVVALGESGKVIFPFCLFIQIRVKRQYYIFFYTSYFMQYFSLICKNN
ncbi:alpha-tubulin suppressor-like RCC1 family protein [Bacillus chungangensis]|uniref:Alpha-tubulin suppressor-like RCC1 family protein n=1 Tax=Bacillus chungangensis TaxID=587633 RepID=A0ABT9WMV3_9BACI|nr:alpha-tubulin suppressor-like RCC1 family protein [Bacillus chungangensis]